MSTDINTITVTGRCTKDAALKTVGDTSLAEFSIASNYFAGKGKEDGVNYFNCTLWGVFAEKMAQYLLKGAPVCVSGELREQRWTDKETQKSRSKMVINVDTLKLCGGKKDAGATTPAPASKPSTAPAPTSGGFDDDEVPF